MVFSLEEESSLMRELISLKQRCAAYHHEEVQGRPGVTPWPFSPEDMKRTGAGVQAVPSEREALRNLPFAHTNYANPSEAARDPRLAGWTFPRGTRLNDIGVYLAMKASSMRERAKLHPYDFVTSGLGISARRVPTGKPVILWAHGLAWIAVSGGGCILCGEKLAPRTGWRLNLKPKIASLPQDAVFFAGIVLAPVDIFPLEPGTFEVELPKHVNGDDVPIAADRHRTRKNQTRFCDHWKDLVIDLTPERPTLTPMYKIPFFKAPCANLSKYPELEFRTDYAPYDLFPSHDPATTDDWSDDFFLFPRYRMEERSEETGLRPQEAQWKTTIPVSQILVPRFPGISPNEGDRVKSEIGSFRPTSPTPSAFSIPNIFETPEPSNFIPTVQTSNNSSRASNAVEISEHCPLSLAATMLTCPPIAVSRADMLDIINQSASAEEIQALYLAYCVVNRQQKKHRESTGQVSDPNSECYYSSIPSL